MWGGLSGRGPAFLRVQPTESRLRAGLPAPLWPLKYRSMVTSTVALVVLLASIPAATRRLPRRSRGSRCAPNSRPPIPHCGRGRSISTNPRRPRLRRTSVPTRVSASVSTSSSPSQGSPYRPLTGAFPLISFSYLHERDHKRELRLDSAEGATAISVSQQADLDPHPGLQPAQRVRLHLAGQGRAEARQGQPRLLRPGIGHRARPPAPRAISLN